MNLENSQSSLSNVPRHCSPEIVNALELKNNLERDGFVVIRNQDLTLEEFRSLGSQLGKIHEEEDVRIKPNEEVLIYSDQAIPLHNDGSEGRYLALYCVEPGDSPVGTWLVDVRDLLETLSSETIEYLKRTEFRRGWGEHEKWFKILTVNEDSFVLYYAPWKLSPPQSSEELTHRREFARYLQNCFVQRGECVTLAKGDALFFDNHHLMHGRDKLPSQSSRWLHRLWIEAE